MSEPLVDVSSEEIDETVTISKERYEELLESENILLALEAGGVRSWQWYEQSLDDYKGED